MRGRRIDREIKVDEERNGKMASFLKDVSKFYGTGEKNGTGQTLDEFLKEYDPYRYKTPSCTTDAVIFAYEGERCETIEGLKILLIKRGNHPSIGFWALPGGFIELEENLEDTARRELMEETGIEGLVMEQLAAYGDFDRDPRARVITTAYMAMVRLEDVKVRAGDDAADAMWCEMELRETALEETKLKEKKEEGGEVRIYRLILKNKERAFETEAWVKCTAKGEGGLIREEKFTVVRQGRTASDYAAIIVQGLLKIKERMRKS